MKNLSFKSKLTCVLGGSAIALLLAYKVIAQTPVPTSIDFDNGPLVAKSQPSNVVLALSVEFPTSGGAYKDGTYVDGKEYVGYFNSSRCYDYPGYGSTPRATATFATATDYFTPTGATNATYQCNVGGSGTGFSGNYLNYATMSAPDILRMALTGGDRGVDQATKTVLERGTISPTGSAPFSRAVNAALVPRVSPFNLAVNLYAQNCADRVIFSTNSDINIARNCALPLVGDASDLSPVVATTVVGGTTTATPTIPPFQQVGTAFVNTGGYTSALPTTGPVEAVTFYTTTQALTTTPFSCPPGPPCVTQAGPAVDTAVKSASYVASGTSPLPAAAGLPFSAGLDRTPKGLTDSGQDGRDSQGYPPPYNSSEVLLNNTRICHDPASPRVIRYKTTTVNINQAYCNTNYPGTTYANVTGNTGNRTVYSYFTGSLYYTAYTATNSYWAYTPYTVYRVYSERAVWNTFVPSAKSIVKPRPLVCDSTEGPTRTVVYGTGTTELYNYCTKYDNGGSVGYKPEGQIQQKSDNLRISVFSYLMDDAQRYGGVMRAPMKYVGPNMRDATTGALVTNPEKEWSLTTGVFVTKPITDSVSTGYTYTGVINYLNRFGKTGNYKTYDNVGELWYESLRYLQGLAPTPNSTAGMSEGMKDGYPVYSAWTDPVTSACQRRNYILGIGDTNQHYDRSLPGITRAEQTAIFNEGGTAFDFAYSTTPTINGVATALNAHDWTRIMDGFERNGAPTVAYTDSLGNARTTAGFNSARNTSLGNLDTSATGSSNHSSYHWAGLSYWANTQAIRKDTKDGVSMDKIRVKTFMIDVDENNEGSVNANIKRTGYYLAGKYGYFDDKAQTGNPFSGTSENERWADGNGEPNGYVLASQPKRLIGGVVKFFDANVGSGNSFATVAVSNSSLSKNSPDGSQFVPSYIPGEWSGTVQKVALKLNTVTNTIEPGSVTWDAGAILTAASLESGVVALPQVKPADRKIFTYISGTTPRAVSFTYAATGNGADLPASFNAVPYTGVVDNQAQARIDYLRGVRTKEFDETFRPRGGIMGDIIGSGPAYKAGANTTLSGPNYAAYVAAKKSRTPVVYTGANDGMLHAIKADNGQELFAYVPGAVLEKMPKLTSKSYVHELFVDAVPAVDEVLTDAGWKTVLASAMGGGAQGIFALDVSDPTSFSESKVMFEFTDKDDPYMGNVTSDPQFVKMLVPGSSPATYKSYIVVNSGYNNYKNDGTGRFASSPDQALFFLDVNKAIGTAWSENSNYFKVVLPAADATKQNGLAKPGIRLGSAGEAIEFFAGDLQGNLWKAAFPEGINTANILTAVRKNASTVKTPLFTARDSATNLQPITVAPVIYPYAGGGNMVIFGTGKLFESTDRSTTTTHSLYGIWDSGQTNAGSYNLLRAKLDQKTVDAGTHNVSGVDSAYANITASKRGWYADMIDPRERLVVDPVATTGVVNIASTIPPSSECSDFGQGNIYYLDPASGDSVADTVVGTGYFGKGYIIDLDTSTSTSSSYSDRGVSGSRTATKKVAISNRGSTGETVTKYLDVTYLRTGRVYWREVRDFNLVSQ